MKIYALIKNDAFEIMKEKTCNVNFIHQNEEDNE